MVKPVFVTGNPNKTTYFSKLIGIEFDHHKLDLGEIQSTDLRKITEDKARRAYDILRRPILVEDVGLFFNALGNLPGPFIKFFVEEREGLEKLCRMLDGFSNRRAHTVVMTTYFDGETFTHFEGGASGEIATSPRGTGGYGYDAIWCVDGYGGKTRAELNKEDDGKSYLEARPLAVIREFFMEKIDEK
ncbi:Ham1 family protein [Candidatus Saccharibacteria bacterium RAAC3_TM7_1]|nr:Ham1 family protein [Candidatus Saccharibacteria bacterium RAAC3_TM7_1]